MSELILSRLDQVEISSLNQLFSKHDECQLTLKFRDGRYDVNTEPISPNGWDSAEFRICHSRSPFDLLVCPASHHDDLVSVYLIRFTLNVLHPVELLRALSEMDSSNDKFTVEHIRNLVELRLQEKLIGDTTGVVESEVREKINRYLSSLLSEIGLTADLSSLSISSKNIDVSDRNLVSKSSGDLEVRKMKMTYRRVVDSLMVSKQKTVLDDVIVLGNCTIDAQGCQGTIWLREGQALDNRKTTSHIKVMRSKFDLARMLMRIETEGEL